ncbi:protein UPSTREAM OF FLC-like [Punica granatum]|uniref:Protein UPSTREAM OF FLC-like n=1 Tax=Punica granatum TaxID=22663 RepID=A0A6P8E6C3_PUNGR|nr:protein UPSTREAM OF FLC-like [Punica granatum]
MAETFRRTRMMDLPNSKKWRDRQPSPDLMKTRRKESADDEPNLTLQTERSRGRVAVVYYLSRNGQLRHPHFIEVPLSSSQWLSLRDFIRRLDQLRGKGMASPYSWVQKEIQERLCVARPRRG